MSHSDPSALLAIGRSRLVVSRLRLRDALRDHRGWTRLPALLDEFDAVRRTLQRASGGLQGPVTPTRHAAQFQRGDTR